MMTRLVWIATLLCLAGPMAAAKGKVWRCTDAQGRTVYQDTACAGAATDARPVDAADPRGPAAVAEAQRRTKAEQTLGEKMTQERRDAERKAAQQRPIQLAGPPSGAASAATADAKRRERGNDGDPERDRSRARDRAKTPLPEGQTPSFRPPGALQKSAPAAP